MNNQLINDLNQIIEQKLELFKEIYNITLAQQKDIEDHEADNIEALVQKKQQVIDKIDKLDGDFLASYNKLKEAHNLDSLDLIDTEKHPEMKNIKTHIKSIMGMAHKIMELENSNKDKLDKIFQNVKSELRQINVGKRSLNAYEPKPVYNDGVFIDKKK
ncbi:MAG TPA: flagellar export chaperone FlgN [Patescibacteria group bacterium]|nr:flagellar export chaperone FlgN [Patescibacteria group bacterium]